MIDRLMELADKEKQAEYEREKEEIAILTIRRYRARNVPDSEIAAIIVEDFKLSDDRVRELMARA